MKQRGHKLSGLLKILLTVLLIFLVYWVELPPMNPRSPQFWTFLVFAGAICLIVNFFSTIRDFFYTLPGPTCIRPAPDFGRLENR